MVVSRACPPLLPPLLLLECVLEPPITQAEILTRVSLAHSRTGNRQLDGGTAPSTTLSGAHFVVSEDARVLLLACPATQHRLPLSKAHGLLRCLRTIRDYGVVPAAGTSVSSVISSLQPGNFILLFRFDSENARFQRRSPRSWSEFGDGNRASSAVPLSRGIYSAVEVPAPNAAPINHGTGVCALRASPQARIAQQYSCGDGASPFYANVFTPPST